MKGYQLMIPTVLTGLLLLSHQTTTANAATNYGFQSGYQFSGSSGAVDGNSYGGSLYYDSDNKLVYITGGTYWSYWDRAGQTLDDASRATYLRKSDCFLGVFKLTPDGATSSSAASSSAAPSSNSMKLIFADRFGSADIPEACSAVTLMNNNDNSSGSSVNTGVITAGHTEEGGFLTSLRPLGSQKSKMYGFLLDINLRFDKSTSSSSNGETQVQTANRVGDGGMLFNDMKTQYPTAMTTNPDPSKNEVYIVSLSSMYYNENDYTQTTSRPDLTAGGGMDEPNYGQRFNIVLHKVIRKDDDEINYEDKEIDLYAGEKDEGGVEITMKSDWTQIYSVNHADFELPPSTSSGRKLGSKNEFHVAPHVRVADLMFIPRVNSNGGETDSLIMVGTTNGNGDAFGGMHKKHGSTPVHHSFVTKLNTAGEVLDTLSIHLGKEFVSIKGMCYDRHNNEQHLFVVGETTGRLDKRMNIQDLTVASGNKPSKHAFLAKIDMDDFETVWTRQLGSVGGNDVIGYGCAVRKSDNIVYMAGTVKGGDSLKVLQNDIDDSDNRIRADSAGKDDVFVANYHATSGDANFVRQFGTAENDSIAKGNGIVIGEDGDAIILGNTRGSMMRWRGDAPLSSDTNPSDVFIMSVAKGTGDTKIISEVSKIVETPVDADDDEVEIPGEEREQSQGFYGFEYVAAAISATIIFASLLYVGYTAIDPENTSSVDNGNKISDYMRDFHDEDVTLHIRHSATGGVHGIYSPKKPDPKSPAQFQGAYIEGNGANRELFSSNDKKQVSFQEPITADSSNAQLSEELSKIEADHAFQTDRTMVHHIDKEQNKPPPKAKKMNSTPVFDGVEKMHGVNDIEGNFGLNNRRSGGAPPSHAFAHSSDDNDDDDWETEIL
jgi:hypothetical protein